MVNSEQLQNSLKVSLMLHLSNFAAICVYIALAWAIKNNKLAITINTEQINATQLRYIFYIVSAGVMACIFVLPKILLSEKNISNQEMLLARLKTFSIIRSALCEVPATLGLILFLFSRQEADLYIFCGVSFILLSALLPRQEKWEELINKQKP